MGCRWALGVWALRRFCVWRWSLISEVPRLRLRLRLRDDTSKDGALLLVCFYCRVVEFTSRLAGRIHPPEHSIKGGLGNQASPSRQRGSMPKSIGALIRRASALE